MLPRSRYLNGARLRRPSSAALDRRSAAWMPDCIATSATPGRSSSAIRSPTTKTSGWPGSEQSGSTRDAPGAVGRRPRGLGEQPAERRGLDAGRPDLGPARQPCATRPGPSTTIPSRSTSVTTTLQSRSFTPSRCSSPAALPESRSPNVARISVAAVEEHDLARRPGRCAGSCPSAPGARARRSGRPSRPRSARRRPRRRSARPGAPRGLSPISAISKAPRIRPRISSASSTVFIAGANRVNSSCPKYELEQPAATIRCRRESRSVADRAGRPWTVAAVEVEAGHRRPARPSTLLVPAQDPANRRRDLALGEDPRRQLVEQRLEQVVVGAVDEGHVDLGTPQELGREEPAEAAADDDHPWSRSALGDIRPGPPAVDRATGSGADPCGPGWKDSAEAPRPRIPGTAAALCRRAASGPSTKS